MGFWSEVGEALGFRERLPNRGRHSRNQGRKPAPNVTRMHTREKYGPGGKPARTRVQLEDRMANQPRRARGVATVEPKLRTRNPSAGARANVAGRGFGQGRSFASAVRSQPPSVWWGNRASRG